MSKTRLEAFSDGVMAILITIMVLELKSPAGAGLHALLETLPELAIYALSFVILGIYWSNHHHMLQATERVSGSVLWANLHLLFWLCSWLVSRRIRPSPRPWATTSRATSQSCSMWRRSHSRS